MNINRLYKYQYNDDSVYYDLNLIKHKENGYYTLKFPNVKSFENEPKAGYFLYYNKKWYKKIKLK